MQDLIVRQIFPFEASSSLFWQVSHLSFGSCYHASIRSFFDGLPALLPTCCSGSLITDSESTTPDRPYEMSPVVLASFRPSGLSPHKSFTGCSSTAWRVCRCRMRSSIEIVAVKKCRGLPVICVSLAHRILWMISRRHTLLEPLNCT